MTELTAVSLFAGIEGFGYGLEQAGIPVVAAVEIDEAARGVIADQYPKTVLFNDVTEVTGDQLRATGFVPDRGIITAGWPCTGNSVAGRRQGMDDPRSGLWRHVVRLLAETRPAWFIGENVPGLYSVNGGRDITVVRRDLAQLGYWWAERVLDASGFGVPQRRRRVIFVGHFGDGAAPVEVLLEPEGSRGDPAPRRTTRTGSAAVAALSASDGGEDDNDDIGSLICGPLQAAGSGGRGHRVDAEGAATGHLGPISLDFSTGVDVAQTVRAANGQPGVVAVPISHDAYSRGEGVAKTASPDADGIVRLRDPGFNVGDDGDPAAAVVAAGPGAVGTANAVRRLTPGECEALQGFPPGWTATSYGQPQSDSARYRQLGNAVATPVIAWVARRLVAVDADRT